MNKIRIIDLLNKIANGEEVPKKIKYRKCIFEYEKKYKDYFTKDGIIPTTFDNNGLFRNIFADYNNFLNNEVEIIEEDNKEIAGKKHAENNVKLEAFINELRYYKKLSQNEIEEEKKIPEKLPKYADVSGDLACEWSFGEKKLKDKINEIIDYLDYLKSKGDE